MLRATLAVNGYNEARLQFPKPKHIPAQVAWNNAVCNIKKSAAPIIGYASPAVVVCMRDQ